jgi:hypothetical protein
MTSKETVAQETTKPQSEIMAIERLLLKHDIKLDDSTLIEVWPNGIFIHKKKATIWDFVGKIKAIGSIEEEREAMIEAAVAHAMGEDEEERR